MKITYLICPLIKYTPAILLKSNDLHLVLSQRGMIPQKSVILGRNIFNCILYNFQINWASKSYSNLSYIDFPIIAFKFILILLKLI